MSRHTRRCGFATSPEELSEHDRLEIEKFKQFLGVEKARRDGADSNACDLLEIAIYPEGIGRETPKGDA